MAGGCVVVVNSKRHGTTHNPHMHTPLPKCAPARFSPRPPKFCDSTRTVHSWLSKTHFPPPPGSSPPRATEAPRLPIPQAGGAAGRHPGRLPGVRAEPAASVWPRRCRAPAGWEGRHLPHTHTKSDGQNHVGCGGHPWDLSIKEEIEMKGTLLMETCA